MSDPRSTQPYRRLDLHRVAARGDGGTSAARTSSVASSWTSQWWPWLAAIAAAMVILGLAFGSSVVRDQFGEPTTSGSAPHESEANSPAPESMPAPPRAGDAD